MQTTLIVHVRKCRSITLTHEATEITDPESRLTVTRKIFWTSTATLLVRYFDYLFACKVGIKVGIQISQGSAVTQTAVFYSYW